MDIRITSTPSTFGFPLVSAEVLGRNGVEFEAVLAVAGQLELTEGAAPAEAVAIESDSSVPAQVDIEAPTDSIFENQAPEIAATAGEHVAPPKGRLPWDDASALPAPDGDALHSVATLSAGVAQEKVTTGNQDAFQVATAHERGADLPRDSALDQPDPNTDSAVPIFGIASAPPASHVPLMSGDVHNIQPGRPVSPPAPAQVQQPLPAGDDATPPSEQMAASKNKAVAPPPPVTEAVVGKPLATPHTIKGTEQPVHKDGLNLTDRLLRTPASDGAASTAFERYNPSRASAPQPTALRGLDVASQIIGVPAQPIAHTTSYPELETSHRLTIRAAEGELSAVPPADAEQPTGPAQPVERSAIFAPVTAARQNLAPTGVDQPSSVASGTVETIPKTDPIPQRIEIRNTHSAPVAPAAATRQVSQLIQPTATTWRSGGRWPGEDASSEIIPALAGHAPAIAMSAQITPATGAAPPPPSRQLTEAILSSGAEARETELTLMPEELGRVRFAISNTDGVVTISITADRPDTLALLRRNVDLLATDLSQSGLQGATIDFGASGQHQKDGRAAQSMWPARQGVTEAQPGQAIATAGTRPHIAGRLDLRL